MSRPRTPEPIVWKPAITSEDVQNYEHFLIENYEQRKADSRFTSNKVAILVQGKIDPLFDQITLLLYTYDGTRGGKPSVHKLVARNWQEMGIEINKALTQEGLRPDHLVLPFGSYLSSYPFSSLTEEILRPIGPPSHPRVSSSSSAATRTPTSPTPTESKTLYSAASSPYTSPPPTASTPGSHESAPSASRYTSPEGSISTTSAAFFQRSTMSSPKEFEMRQKACLIGELDLLIEEMGEIASELPTLTVSDGELKDYLQGTVQSALTLLRDSSQKPGVSFPPKEVIDVLNNAMRLLAQYETNYASRSQKSEHAKPEGAHDESKQRDELGAHIMENVSRLNKLLWAFDALESKDYSVLESYEISRKPEFK